MAFRSASKIGKSRGQVKKFSGSFSPSSSLPPPLGRLSEVTRNEHTEEDPGYHSSESPVAGDGYWAHLKSSTKSVKEVSVEREDRHERKTARRGIDSIEEERRKALRRMKNTEEEKLNWEHPRSINNVKRGGRSEWQTSQREMNCAKEERSVWEKTRTEIYDLEEEERLSWEDTKKGENRVEERGRILWEEAEKSKWEETRRNVESVEEEKLKLEESRRNINSVEEGKLVCEKEPGRDSTSSGTESLVDVEGEKSEMSSDEENSKDSSHLNPLMDEGVHRDLWCCTNGHFSVVSGVFSEFESNCGCTTHNLVDWSTRVVWSNRDLRHRYKIREVTYLSPYRESCVFPGVLSCSLVLRRLDAGPTDQDTLNIHHTPARHSVPHLNHTTSHLQDTPHLHHTTPHHSHSTPRFNHGTPHLIHNTPQSSQGSFNLHHTTPHLNHTTPHLQHTAPHLQHTTPHLQHATPHLQHTTPHLQHATPHLQHATSPRGAHGGRLTTSRSTPIVKQEAVRTSRSSEEERAFVCGEAGCGRAFCRNEELTRHLRIHSGYRPFVCEECSRGFVRRDHLTKHLRTHLPSHVKRTYTCPLPVCTHRYTRSDALTRHMWTAHHVRARQPARTRTHTHTHTDPTLTRPLLSRKSTPSPTTIPILTSTPTPTQPTPTPTTPSRTPTPTPHTPISTSSPPTSFHQLNPPFTSLIHTPPTPPPTTPTASHPPQPPSLPNPHSSLRI